LSAAISTAGLGKRYGKRWGLNDCTVEIPEGRVVALVGPNGAGKTTLLHLATGILEPTTGSVSVLGLTPNKDKELLPRFGFVAQEVPLYVSFTVAEMLEFGRRVNLRWDEEIARRRLAEVGVELDTKVGQLSGGHRSQVALSLALAKRPEVLLLDEPLASLDPLARRAFMGGLMQEVTEKRTTVVLSSHLLSDLERVCDFVVVLSGSHLQIAGDIEDLLASHCVLTGRRREPGRIAGVASIVQQTNTERQTTLLVRTDGPILDPAWTADTLGLEELVLAYMGRPSAPHLPARLEASQ
jgi:ABC-2 type transport system ATP-binding protein